MEDIEQDDKVAVINPEGSGMPARWFWNGKPYEMAPGEVKTMKPFMAEHARKHNSFLQVADMAATQVELAKMQATSAKAREDAARQALEKAAEDLRRAQAQSAQAAANVKAKEEEDRRLAEQEAEAKRLAEKQEADRLAAAKRAAGVKA